MNCCKLSCCILMAWLTRVSALYRTGHGEGCITYILLWKPELYKINVGQMWGHYCLSVKLATADDAAFVLLLWWGMIRDLPQGLTIQIPPTRLSSGNQDQQDEFIQDHHFATHSHSQLPLEAAVCAVRLEHIHVYEHESHKGLMHFLWSFMLAVQ